MNPIIDTSKYMVEFPDGAAKEWTENLIAESMFSNVDQEVHHLQIMEDISDHRKSKEALEKKDGFYRHGKNWPNIPRKTTMGWELLFHWKEGSSNWVKLKDLKQSTLLNLQNML